MSINYRIDEGCDEPTNLAWDSVWNSAIGMADWAISEGDEPQNYGGLRAKQAIATAVILCLFTDKRCPNDPPLAYLANNDFRGWWGDKIDVRDDLGEQELGSLLWLLERSTLTQETERWAKSFVVEALSPLLKQKVVANIKVETAINNNENRLDMNISLFAKDGAAVYSQRFALLWSQVK